MPRSPTVFNLVPGTVPQVPDTPIPSAMFNAAMLDFEQTFNTPQPIEYGGTNATNAANARSNLGLSIGTNVSPIVLGHLFGLTIANNVTDATNDINIAAGTAVDNSGSISMVLASSLTKQLDAVWAVGNNAGMRASGAAIANTTYHIFLIRRPDTGVVDIAADTSATGANIAANTNAAYTQIRRIGSILRESGSITQFFQRGRQFSRIPLIYYSQSNPGTASLLVAAPTPIGINTKVQTVASIATTATSSDYGLLVSDLNLDQVSATTALCTTNLQTLTTAGVYRSSGYSEVVTDLSARTRVQISRSDANTTISLMCYGWEDITL